MGTMTGEMAKLMGRNIIKTVLADKDLKPEYRELLILMRDADLDTMNCESGKLELVGRRVQWIIENMGEQKDAALISIVDASGQDRFALVF